jgi:MoaA/NifB/PqqE/SkfB family radical SAM enzyme
VSKAAILAGIDAGSPTAGPATVHIARPASWKKRSLALGDFDELIAELHALGGVRSIILSGMGEPLVHPHIYGMMRRVKDCGWELSVLTNLIAADIDQLTASGVDQLLVGVHGATPPTYAAFHPGWDESHFFTMCNYLRQLRSAGVCCRHVQVINRDTAPELVAMVRFGKMFGADRVNFKLASLDGGTEDCGITADQRDWMLAEAIPEARDVANAIGARTNLELFERQVRAAGRDLRATTPIESIGCFMGYAYTRITVDRDVLFCCNTEVRVGSLAEAGFSELWYGPAWQGLRDRLRDGRYFRGCDRCGKLEQNHKWSERYRAHAGEARWLAATGRAGGMPRPAPELVRLPRLG